MKIYIISIFILAFLGLPVAFALGSASLIFIIFGTDLPIYITFQRMLTGIDSFPFLAIPFFILAGNLMNKGGLTDRIIDFSRSMVGHFYGGLAAVSIVGSMIFAGVSGSSVADASGLGSILIPAMKKEGYDKEYSAAINAVSSTVGIIIPPSIPMILAGVATALSIRDLFLGGAIPGIMVGLLLLVISTLISKKRNYPKTSSFSFKNFFKTLVRAFPAIFAVIIILGGILGGIFTATEASVIAVVYAFLIGKFFYKELKLSHVPDVFKEVSISTSIVLFIIATASITTWLLAYLGLPALLSTHLPALFPTERLMVFGLSLLFILSGTFIDVSPGVILFGPILMPTARAAGIDPIYFSVIMVFSLAIGLFTPPVGTTLFISCYLADSSIIATVKETIIFFLAMIFILGLIILFPQLVTWLPSIVS